MTQPDDESNWNKPIDRSEHVPEASSADTRGYWSKNVVLTLTAFASWGSLVWGFALEMRNMFGGPPPDAWGIVFIFLSLVSGLFGIVYFCISLIRCPDLLDFSIRTVILLLLLVANSPPVVVVLQGLLTSTG